MQNQTRALLTSLYDSHAAELPARIGEAVAALAVSREVRDAIDTETAPDLDTRDAKRLTASITARALHDATRTQRLELAQRVEREAESALGTAWDGAVTAMHADMAGWFATAAENFLTASASGDRDRLDQYAAELSAIRAARAALHGRLEVTALPFWQWTQIVAVDSLPTALHLNQRMSDNALPGQPRTADGSAAWWAKLAAVPGVTLRYHTPHEQAAMYARYVPRPKLPQMPVPA